MSRMFRSPYLLLEFVCLFLPFSRADSGWIRLSLTGPNGTIDPKGITDYYVNNVLVGTPPATQSLRLIIDSPGLGFSSDDCIFCPGIDLFRPSLSSTYNSTNQPWPGPRDIEFDGVLAQDTVSFGGVLTDKETPLKLIQQMSHFYTHRFLDGYLGLYVDTSTEDKRNQHILTRLHSSGQLLNPVVGLRLGDTPETSHLSIGALDPNEFEGTLNWVPAESPDPTWNASAVVKIDGIRGFNGSLLPYKHPLPTYLSSINERIVVPNSWTYISHEGYRGPIDSIYTDTLTDAFSYRCDETQPYVHMSVDINGVTYQLDSLKNLIGDISSATLVDNGYYCEVLIHNQTTSDPIPSLLGLPFLRSIYLAYRFPTEDCPNAYYGFAFPRGANRTSSMISQHPRETPSASAQCLSFATPTSTPTVSTPAPQGSADPLLSRETYEVWMEDGQQVRLKGANELAPALVRGVETVDS